MSIKLNSYEHYRCQHDILIDSLEEMVNDPLLSAEEKINNLREELDDENISQDEYEQLLDAI